MIYQKQLKDGLPGVKPLIEVKRVSAKEIPLNGLLEIDLNVTANFQNPFNPEEVDVVAIVTTESGREFEIPAFYYQDFGRKLEDGKETLTPNGEPFWKVRFTPVEVGKHTVCIKLKDEGEIVTSGNLTFDVYQSNRLGFVEVSKTDRRFFQFTTGQSFFFIGHDVCWFGSRGTYDYDEWFSSMNLNGENITRIWMAPWAFGIEWKRLGHYDQVEAWRLDYVLKKAEEKGIYVILCLMNHGQLQSDGLTGEWNDNPYN